MGWEEGVGGERAEACCLFSSLTVEVFCKGDILKVGFLVMETKSKEGPACCRLEIKQL